MLAAMSSISCWLEAIRKSNDHKNPARGFLFQADSVSRWRASVVISSGKANKAYLVARK